MAHKKTRAHNAPVHDTPEAREPSAFNPTLEQKQAVKKYSITGSELKSVLVAHGSSQMEFAKFINCAQATISRYCTGGKRKIKFRVAKKLEEFVGTDLYLTVIAERRKISRATTELSTKKELTNNEESI